MPLTLPQLERHLFRQRPLRPVGVGARVSPPSTSAMAKCHWASKADLMFLQHMLAVLADGGLVATVMSHSVLFRGGEEKTICPRRNHCLRSSV